MGGSLDSREIVKQHAERAYGRAYDLSHRIHANPELGFQEHLASGWLAEELRSLGYETERGVGGLDTAVLGEIGSGDLVAVICAEYDALPEIGHACGHNVIAAAALVAAAALAPVAASHGIRVRVIGTPAEEGGGGKVILLENGVFTGANLAMMVHPAPGEADRMPVNAAVHLNVGYTGKTAHASAFPQLGINALDAMSIAQISIGLLRQHIYPYDRIHGIITKGGDAPNVIPAQVEGAFIARSKTLADLEILRPRIERCFEAGALATGATLSIEQPWPAYSEFVSDEDLAGLYVGEATALGRVFPKLPPLLEASTDMANISLEVPSIHPMLSIESWPAVNHQPEFTEAAKSAAADRAMYEGGVAMALTILDAATSPLRERLLAHACR